VGGQLDLDWEVYARIEKEKKVCLEVKGKKGEKKK
jgi:hypothetical protein